MSAESKTRNKTFFGYMVCVLCFGLTIWAFYPGFMSPDSIGNLADGRSGVFADINSPVMSYLWGRLDRIVAGPALMLVLQNAVFWSGCAVFWHATHKKSIRLGACLILFALLPHILSQLPVVWKDVGLGTCLFLSAALVYLADKTKNKTALFASILFLFYAYAARLNALPAILPLAIWSGFVFGRIFETGKGKLFSVVAGIVYFAALSLAIYFVNDRLTEGRTVYPFQQIYLYDLAAISKEKNAALFPEYVLLDERFSLETVKARYNERSAADLIFENVPNQGDLPVLKLSSDAGQIKTLRDKWLETIAANPSAYLRHRGRIFAQLSGFSRSVTRPFWDLGFAANPPEFQREENLGAQILMKYFGAFSRPFAQTFGFRAFLWLLLCAYFLYRALKKRLEGDWEIVFVLSTSCLLFTFAYFPTTPSTEFRYLFWPAISAAVAIIFGVYLSAQTGDNLLGKFLSKLRK
ncbi:MAG TPA: hypothetical protein VGC76_12055 [Pyrinomonadaceae bacterium]|jgi:hypothetical protein